MLITVVMIIVTALWRVLNMDMPFENEKKVETKILDGIQSEDGDYFESRMSKTVSELSKQIKSIKTASSEKEKAAQEALLQEAKKINYLKRN